MSKFNPEYAYENMNLRFTVDKENTFFSIVNEKGTSLVSLKDPQGDIADISGEYLGHCVLNNIIVLFTTDSVDRIYRIIYHSSSEEFILEEIFQGDLSFNLENPIETLGVYENEDIQKVYWLDGIN